MWCRLDQRRKVGFYEIGCSKCDVSTQPISAKYYWANVEYFDSNLLLWTGKGWGLSLTTTNSYPASCSGKDAAGVRSYMFFVQSIMTSATSLSTA